MEVVGTIILALAISSFSFHQRHRGRICLELHNLKWEGRIIQRNEWAEKDVVERVVALITMRLVIVHLSVYRSIVP